MYQIDIIGYYLLENNPELAIYYIPMKPLFINSMSIIIIWSLSDFILKRIHQKNVHENKLPSSLIYKLIILSQIIPLIVYILFISMKIDIFHGVDMIKIIKFSGNMLNFFIMKIILGSLSFIVVSYSFIKPEVRTTIGLNKFPINKKAVKVFIITFGVVFLSLLLSSSSDQSNTIDAIYFEIQKNIDANLLFLLIIINLFTVSAGEEILFRGLFYTAIKERSNLIVALILQAALFSILHEYMIYTFVFAVMSALLYEKTKSLYPSMILHLSFNLICYILIFLKLNKVL